MDKTDDPLWVDAHHIEIVFRHLLLNAIHFNKKDGRVSIESLERRRREGINEDPWVNEDSVISERDKNATV